MGGYNAKRISQIEFFKLKEKYNSPHFHYVWNKIYKRDIICNAGIEFIPGKNSGEDVVFNNAYFRTVRSVYIVNETLYAYNCLNQSSLTRKNYAGNNEKMSPSDTVRNVENRLNAVLNRYYEQKDFYASIGTPKMTYRYLKRNTYLECLKIMDAAALSFESLLHFGCVPWSSFKQSLGISYRTLYLFQFAVYKGTKTCKQLLKNILRKIYGKTR